MSTNDQNVMRPGPAQAPFKLPRPIWLFAACVVLATAVWSIRNSSSITQPRTEKDAVVNNFETPADDLFRAVYRDDCDGIARMIEAGIAVNSTDEDGRTPIMLAASFGKVKIVELLLSEGGAVDSRDLQGETPLHCAMFDSLWTGGAGSPKHSNDKDMLRVTEMLLAANASVDAADNEGETPLHRAAGIDDPARLSALLAAGAKPNITDNAGRTPLMHAVEARGRTDHLLERMRMLIEKGADAELRNSAGATALQIAQERLEFISSPELSRRMDESNAEFRKLFAPPGLNARTAAELKAGLDDTQENSRAWVASAKTNLPLAIRLLREIASK